MEQLVALLMLATASHSNCLVDTAKYIELITTTNNYMVVETLKGSDANWIKRALDAFPPAMEKVAAMEVDRIYVMGTTDMPQVAMLLYSKKGCLQTVMTIPGRMYSALRKQGKFSPTL